MIKFITNSECHDNMRRFVVPASCVQNLLARTQKFIRVTTMRMHSTHTVADWNLDRCQHHDMTLYRNIPNLNSSNSSVKLSTSLPTTTSQTEENTDRSDVEMPGSLGL